MTKLRCSSLNLRLRKDMGGCQNYGPFLGNLNIRCPIIIGIQKGTIILTTTHMDTRVSTIVLIFKEPWKPGVRHDPSGSKDPNNGVLGPLCIAFRNYGLGL